MFYQTQHGSSGLFGFGTNRSYHGDDARRTTATARPMTLGTVEPLVSRFLALDRDHLSDHFVPATYEHLGQLVSIRQKIVDRTPAEDEAYLKWRYRFSPGPTGKETDDNRIWVFLKEHEVLGFVGVERITIVTGNSRLKALKVMDLAVKPEVDRKGLGVWINLKLQTMGYPIVALGSNRNSVGIMSKLFYRLPNQSVYKSLLNSTRYFENHGRSRFLSLALSTLYNTALPVFYHTRLAIHRQHAQVRQLSRFSPSHNDALAKMHHSRVHLQRTSDYLNWRFFDNPEDRINVMGLWSGDDLIGYLAVAFRSHHGGSTTETDNRAFLLDWGALPGKRYQRCLTAALLQWQIDLRSAGFESISAFTHDTDSARFLRHAGFHRLSDDDKTVSLFAEDPSILRKVISTQEWFLTGADTDYA